MTMASAVELRQKANSIFKLSSSPSLSPCLRFNRLNSACSTYLQALEASVSFDDKASCCKNLGAVHLNIAKLGCVAGHQHHAGGSIPASDWFPLFHLARSASYFCKALDHGRLSGKSSEWSDNIHGSLTQIAITVVDEATKAAEEANRNTFIHSLVFETLVDLSNTFLTAKHRGKASLIAHLGQAQCLHNVTSKLLENRQLLPCKVVECWKDLLKCKYLVQVAEEQAGSAAYGNLEHLRRSILSDQRLCESMQATTAGDDFAKKASDSVDGSKRIDFALGAIDKYKEAEAAARGFHLEAQAIALSSVGKVYEEILRVTSQAITYYSRSLEMVQEADWKDRGVYIKTKTALERLELERKGPREKEREANSRRSKVRDSLQDALSEIQRQFQKLSPMAFLKFVYNSYPPKKRDADVAEGVESGAPTRLAIRKAIGHYHPDHNGCTDESFKIVSEEITKYLLIKYGSSRREKADS